ncbi:MAG TPA: hypothetical protein CFH81_08670 [Sulfurovum sp. UBA12169]|nr:MAG TPA: hypothetical protein CFH81_08670 [Sulfurovum sp. UBA12169]
MKKILMMIAIATAIHAEYFKLMVTSFNPNLYRTDEGIYIETRMCVVVGNDMEAVLDYESYRGIYGNTIRFVSGEECDVVRVFR